MTAENSTNHCKVIPDAQSHLGGFMNCTVTKLIRLVSFRDIGRKNSGNPIREKQICVLENKLLNVCV